MSFSNNREVRLAAYGVLAGMVGSQAAADIQVYEGKPIDLLDGPVTLSLNDFSFDLNILFTSFTTQSQNSMPTCCGYYTTSWGNTYCSWSGSIMDGRFTFASSLSANCGTQMSSIGFGNKGDLVNGKNGCFTMSSICYSNSSYYSDCDTSENWSSSNCGEERRFYIGFSANADGQPVFGWIQIDGVGNELEITKWAYEDCGAPIEIGEVDAPKCDADINGDGKVDAADLGLLIAAWGDCEE